LNSRSCAIVIAAVASLVAAQAKADIVTVFYPSPGDPSIDGRQCIFIQTQQFGGRWFPLAVADPIGKHVIASATLMAWIRGGAQQVNLARLAYTTTCQGYQTIGLNYGAGTGP
jgi:hypothetical protein